MERMFGKVGAQGNRMLTRVLEHLFGMERKKKESRRIPKTSVHQFSRKKRLNYKNYILIC